MASDSTVTDVETDGEIPEGLRSDEALHNPFDWYHKKRHTSPVQYDSQRGVYDVFSYEQVKKGLQDDKRLLRPPLTKGQSKDPLSYFDTAMVWSDGSNHKKVKGELFEYFSPRMLQGVEESIVSITNSELDISQTNTDKFDFVSDFAVPVPLRVIMDVIGVPHEDHDQLLSWLETFRSVMTSEDSADGSIKRGHMEGAAEYFKELVSERRASPENDLISKLAQETELTAEEIGSNCFDFALAGQGTMSELLANAVHILDDNAIVEDMNEYDLDLLLEEILRYRSPLQARARKTKEAVTMGGTTIPADEIVILWIGAANRDPARFADPDVFKPERDPDHLAFGSGAHNCIGAPIARLEAPIVLRTFFDRVTQIDIDYAESVPKQKGSKLGFERMPIKLRE